MGLMLNTGYYKGTSKILFKTLYNKLFDDNYLERTGVNVSNSTDIQYYAFDLLQKSLLKGTLIGEHAFGTTAQNKLDWQLSYNYINNNQPDQRKVTYSRTINTTNPFYAELSNLGKANNRLFSDMDEHIVNAGINYLMPVKLFDKSSVKFGVYEQARFRDFQNRYLGATLNTSVSGADDVRFSALENLYSPANINNGYFKFIDQTLLEGDDYNATAFTTAGYAMMDNLINEKFRLVYGVRAEHYNVNVKNTKRTLVEKQWLDILPSANFTYLMSEKTNLRASYFYSVIRPELREMANLGFYDYELNATMLGNPNLERTKIHNVDLKYEYFPNPGEILSASVFFKSFANTIENQVNADNSAYEVNFANFDKGRNVGVEVELRKRLGFIQDNKFFRNTTFYINAAYTNSVINLPAEYYIVNKIVTTKPLTGQSPLVVNASLGYMDEAGKFGVNLLYNYIGQRLTFVGQGRVGNVFELARNVMDFTASYNIAHNASIRLTVKDILNSKYGFFMDQNVDGKFQKHSFESGRIDPNLDWTWQEYRPGTSIGLSFNYSF